ncbi:MAG: hypothetical protein HKP58_05660 [Desulfatitalea sp.]|nr:hypothetical protein [Desulfatitalea sp.]NNJ99881.1 hypothetical protein [Desulfatitalea sp.]
MDIVLFGLTLLTHPAKNFLFLGRKQLASPIQEIRPHLHLHRFESGLLGKTTCFGENRLGLAFLFEWFGFDGASLKEDNR